VTDPRRATPRTDQVLSDVRLVDAAARLGPGIVKDAVSGALESCRSGDIAPEDVADVAHASLPQAATGLRTVVNATGVVVHTNLGRAPLSPAAINALTLAAGTTDLELDLLTGQRGRRGRSALDALARAVPEAESVHVVNNGAAALALAAAVLASGKNIVIARGELVEIGDGFRIPELLESVGVTLREVGTTNRVRFSDYERAVDEGTGFVLKVHPSNFVVTGFTSTVSVQELSRLPARLVVDIGSGLLAARPRLPDEPNARDTLRDGADLVTASGDKLLGGPQCGLVLGTAELVERLRRHPLARALRVDKLTVAALEATLTGPPTPVAIALDADPTHLQLRAERIADQLAGVVKAEVVQSMAAVGGGGAPGVDLPSVAVAVSQRLAGLLRVGKPPVVGRLDGGCLLLDLIAVPAEQDALLTEAVRRAAADDRSDGDH